MPMAPRYFGRSSPDPGLARRLSCAVGHLHCSLDLMGIGEALASEGIARAGKKAPPAPLLAKSQQALWDEDVLDGGCLR